MTRHFTAWLTWDLSCLDQPYMDLMVQEDMLFSEDPPKWVTDPSKPVLLYAVTSVNAHYGDTGLAIREARRLLADADWHVVGTFTPVPSGVIAVVYTTKEI